MYDDLSIGELAARFGLNPRTIRYYEAIGLLPRPERSASGYRRYDEDAIERLSFIRRAKVLGLSLDEIRDILSTPRIGEPPCGHVLDLLALKINAIDQRIADLVALRTNLANLRAVWTDGDTCIQRTASSAGICPIIEQQTEVGEHPHAAGAFEQASHH